MKIRAFNAASLKIISRGSALRWVPAASSFSRVKIFTEQFIKRDEIIKRISIYTLSDLGVLSIWLVRYLWLMSIIHPLPSE